MAAIKSPYSSSYTALNSIPGHGREIEGGFPLAPSIFAYFDMRCVFAQKVECGDWAFQFGEQPGHIIGPFLERDFIYTPLIILNFPMSDFKTQRRIVQHKGDL